MWSWRPPEMGTGATPAGPFWAFRLLLAGNRQGGPLPTRWALPGFPSISFGISTSSPPGTGGCFAKARCAPLHSHRGSQTGSRALTWPTTQTRALSQGTLDPHAAVGSLLVGSVPPWVLMWGRKEMSALSPSPACGSHLAPGVRRQLYYCGLRPWICAS